MDAEYFLLYEEYRNALPLYIEIHQAFPDNANISFRIGQCYMNIQGQKHRAIPFLERAVKDITLNYREGHFTERQAPREAHLYLGKAYRTQAQFDEALAAFNAYKALLGEADAQQLRTVRREIQSLALAQQMKSTPVPVDFASVGRHVNSRFPELNPLISSCNTILVFTSVQQFFNAIMISTFSGQSWSHPMNINGQLFADGMVFTVGLSADGQTLLLTRNDNDIFNLYISRFDPVRNQWAPMSRLPNEINSRHWETHGSLSPTGDTLYFTSNRPGGAGGFDLYMSVRTAGGWAPAVRLGDQINTPFDEIAPMVSHDGAKLFFASNGHPNMGGFDIFVSYLKNNRWSKPVNMGYPLNTPDDDTFFAPLGNGAAGYMSKNFPDTFGEDDIFHVRFGPGGADRQGPDSNDTPLPLPFTQGMAAPQASSRIDSDLGLNQGR